MDKNKKKADMLAAGRKKLQQFRQKKDNKGSKSSSESGKTESNDNTSSTKRATASQKSGRKEKQSMHDADDILTSSEAHLQGKASVDENSVAAPVVDQPTEAASPETVVKKTNELSPEDSTLGDPELNSDVSNPCSVQTSSIHEGDYIVVEEVVRSSDPEVPSVAESVEQFTDSSMISSVDSQFQLHGQYPDRQGQCRMLRV